jgi:phosphomannomutase/phosphoglucomutase
MFKTTKLAGLVKSKAASNKRAGSSSSVQISAVSAIAVATFVACWLTFQLVQTLSKSESMEREVKASAEGVALNISNQIQIYQQLLGSLAQDKQLIAVFEAADNSLLRTKGNELQKKIPDAKYVRLLPAGWDEQETGVGSKLSFASLSMLRDAEETGRVTLAEVHQFKTEDQHVAMAAPVVLSGDSPRVVGVIHLSLSMEVLNKAISAISTNAGKIYVQQLVGGSSLVLVANGGSSNGRDSSMESIKVSGSIWSVAYKIEGFVIGWSEGLLLFAVLGAGLGAVVLATVILSRRFNLALAEDQKQILRAVKQLLTGKTVASVQAKVPELQATLDQLVRIRQEYNEKVKSKISKKQQIDKATGLPRMAVKDDVVAAPAPETNDALPSVILRNYDIRGIVGKDLTSDVVYKLGRAIGSMAYDKGEQTVIVARDGRKSGSELSSALCRGLMDSGRDVIDIGMVPTPLLYFATNFLGSRSGVMLTGSHNPPDYNGLKIVIAGEALSGEMIQELGRRVASGDLLQGDGSRTEQDLVGDYLNRVVEDVHIARPLKVVLDCGNGVGGVVAPVLLEQLGCKVAELYCDVDGDFPNHHPDPSKPENLSSLIEGVKASKADIGIALDGDADRIGVVDSEGNIIWPDRLLMLLAIDLLARQPGADVIYDVKCSRHLAGQILTHGGRPLMWKSGHSLIKAKMRETGALLAGEMSGHLFFKERWYGFDDAIYACARLLEILSNDPRDSAEIFAELPDSMSTPELSMSLPEGKSVELVEKLIANGDMLGAKIIKIDGIRAEFEHGWGLMRASNTMPAAIFRFEADDINGLKYVQDVFRQELLKIDPELKLPF